ncbi:unnamed protein product [Urochloa humidicola]
MADEAVKTADKQPARLLVVLVKKKKKEQDPAVQFVSLWALLNTFAAAVSLAAVYATPELSSWLFGVPYGVTGTEMLETALEIELGYISCSVLQAAPAALALLLAVHRRKIRRALAYAALAVSAAGHCMLASEAGCILLIDDPVEPPGGLSLRIWYAVDIFVFAAGDLLCFMALFVFASGDLLCFMALLRGEGRRSRVKNKDY